MTPSHNHFQPTIILFLSPKLQRLSNTFETDIAHFSRIMLQWIFQKEAQTSPIYIIFSSSLTLYENSRSSYSKILLLIKFSNLTIFQYKYLAWIRFILYQILYEFFHELNSQISQYSNKNKILRQTLEFFHELNSQILQYSNKNKIRILPNPLRILPRNLNLKSHDIRYITIFAI